ncbi:MAG: RNA-directed DNA polymerase, partial [Gammaproteobacteria bacterium]|nr:RNA-directed DNA polymerase [Gammaproteobacteria bacterium]
MDDESRPLTTTITPLGLRQYKRLPMGLKDSASAFQKRVHNCLAGLEGVEVYIDDILIHGKTQEEHDRRLRAALSRLLKAGFRLQEKKLEIGKREISAFGHQILEKVVKPDLKNVEAIQNAPRPATIKEVQRFLGMIYYFQDFLKDVSSIAEPLRKLTRKEAPFTWEME